MQYLKKRFHFKTQFCISFFSSTGSNCKITVKALNRIVGALNGILVYGIIDYYLSTIASGNEDPSELH